MTEHDKRVNVAYQAVFSMRYYKKNHSRGFTLIEDLGNNIKIKDDTTGEIFEFRGNNPDIHYIKRK